MWILAIFYIGFIRFALPYPFMAYENYHGIEFLNQIYGNQPCSISCYSFQNFFQDITNTTPWNWPDSGFVPRLMYGPLVQIFSQHHFVVLYVQAFLSIVTALFLSMSGYFIFQRNVLFAAIFFLVCITFPYNIKYGLTEDYYVVGNFFASLWLLSAVLYAWSTQFRYAVLFLVAMAGAIYTRDLYMLTLPLIFVAFLYTTRYAKTFQTIFSNYRFYILTWALLGIIFHRLPYIFWSTIKFWWTEPIVLSLTQRLEKFSYFYDFFPLTYEVFILIAIIYSFSKFRRLVYAFPLYMYVWGLLYFYSQMQIMEMALLRHTHLLVPILLSAVSFGIYIAYKGLWEVSKKGAKIGAIMWISCILCIPYFYKEQIQHLYNVQQEALFIEQNISHLPDRFLLFFPDRKWNTTYVFPSYMFKSKENTDIFIMKIGDFKNIEGIEKSRDSIFYLSTACYIFPFEKNPEHKTIQDDCQYVLDTYTLEPIAEKKMKKESYVFPINSTLDTITIGFYKVLSKKENK